MATTPTFAVKQSVKFKLHTGRTGAGVIDSISNGTRGAFYAVKDSAGKITKVRAAHLKPA